MAHYEPKYQEIGYDLESLFELNLKDLLILQQLSKYTGPTLRFTILEDINAQLPESKQFTSTKFYYALDRLEKLGYITSEEGDKKRTMMIEKTLLVDLGLDSLFKSLISAKFDFLSLFKELIPRIAEQFELNFPLKKLLVVIPEYEKVIDTRKIELLSNLTEDLFVMTSDELYQHYMKKNRVKKIRQTTIIENQIREPNDFFDLCIYLSFDYEFNYKSDEEGLQLIKELMRITKVNGLLLLTGFLDYQRSSHFVLESIYNQVDMLPIFNPENTKVMNELIKTNMSDYPQGDIKRKGLLINWIIKNR